MTFVPFADANDIGDRFLDLLSRNQIQPQTNSSLEGELLSLTQLIDVTKNPSRAEGTNQASLLRVAAGVHDLAAKVLSVEPLPEFQAFLSHLRLIAKVSIWAASIVQNKASAPSDDTARKMAELYLGCLAAHVGTQVKLDSPDNAKGDNPDVVFTVKERSLAKGCQEWALAIKTISSKQGQTIFERIKEGAKQIERCSAEKGMVVINTKNALDHDALWSTEFSNEESALGALAKQLGSLVESANENRPQAEWDDLFKGKTVRPVLFLGQTVVCLPTSAGQKTPTALKMLHAYGAGGSPDRVGYELACGLNHFMQTILRGIPGTSEQPPC